MSKTRKAAVITASVVLCAALALSALFLTACGASGYFAEPEDNAYLTHTELISDLEGCDIGTGTGRTYVVSRSATGGTEYGLYDFAARSFVASFASGTITQRSGVFVRTSSGTEGANTYEVYTNTQRIGSYTDAPDIVGVSRTHTRVDAGEDIYFVDKATGEYTEAENPLGRYIDTNAEYETGKYLIAEASASNVYEYYDADTFEYVRTIDAERGLPSGDESMTHVLSNGNIVVQVIQEVPDDSENADVYASGTMYDIITHIIDADNGKHKDKETDFFIGDVDNAASNASFEDTYDCDNVATIAYIDEDARALTNEATVVLSDSLKVKYDFSEIAGISGRVTYLGSDRYIISGDLYDGGGELLANNVTRTGGSMYFRKTAGDRTRIYNSYTLEEVYSHTSTSGTTYMYYAFNDKLVVYENVSDGNDTVRVINSRGSVSTMSVTSFGYSGISVYGIFTATDENGNRVLCAISEDGGITRLLTPDGTIAIEGTYLDDRGEYAGAIVTAGDVVYVVTEK